MTWCGYEGADVGRRRACPSSSSVSSKTFGRTTATCSFRWRSPVLLGHERIVVAHHRDAGRRWHTDHLGLREHTEEVLHQWKRLRAVPRVVVHLSAAGLRLEELDRVLPRRSSRVTTALPVSGKRVSL